MMLLDYFGVLHWQFRGPTLRRRDPTQRRGRERGLDKPQVRRGVAKLSRGEGLRRSVAMLRRGVALFTDMCFCHVFLFCYSDDLSIRLMRTI